MYARALDFAGSRDSERQELLVSVGREGGCGNVEEGRAKDRGGMRQVGYEGGLLPEPLLVTTAEKFIYGPNHKGKITGIREEWGKKSVKIKTGRAGVRRA